MEGYSFEKTRDGRTLLATADGATWAEVGPREVVTHPKLGVPVFGVVCREFFLENGQPVYDRDDLKIAALIGTRRPDGVEMLRPFPAATIEEAQAIVTKQLQK